MNNCELPYRAHKADQMYQVYSNKVYHAQALPITHINNYNNQAKNQEVLQPRR